MDDKIEKGKFYCARKFELNEDSDAINIFLKNKVEECKDNGVYNVKSEISIMDVYIINIVFWSNLGSCWLDFAYILLLFRKKKEIYNNKKMRVYRKYLFYFFIVGYVIIQCFLLNLDVASIIRLYGITKSIICNAYYDTFAKMILFLKEMLL